MTLQQLKYADAIADCSSISEAAQRVFATQPTLTEAIRLGEEERRESKRGTLGKAVRRPQFAVSCQHYAFVIEAFMEVVRRPQQDVQRGHRVRAAKLDDDIRVSFMTFASVTVARAFLIVALRSAQMLRAGHFAWRPQVCGAVRHFRTETGPSSVSEMSRMVMSSGGLARRSPPPAPRSARMRWARFRGTASLLMNAAEMSCDAAIAPIVRGDSFCS